MKLLFYSVLITILLSVLVTANGNHDHALDFPDWTYYAEIVEHSAIVVVAIVAILMHIPFYKTFKDRINLLNCAVIGWVILLVSQILVNLHHFLIYPFGVFTAIVHHGLLLVSVIVLAYSYTKLLKTRTHEVIKNE